MKFRITKQNIMDCSADAILLTIDGVATSMEGNIARLFQRQYPEAWEEIGYDIDYPLPLGNTLAFDVHEEHTSARSKKLLSPLGIGCIKGSVKNSVSIH